MPRPAERASWNARLTGNPYRAIQSVRGVLKPAFQMAYNEDVIRKNPFNFKLADVVANDSRHRVI